LPRNGYRLGLPREGSYKVIINTDADSYGGSGTVSLDSLQAEDIPAHTQQYSAIIDLPALATIWLLPQRSTKSTSEKRRIKKQTK
jgi:1,4-alpha-glucan branching enzyme